MEKLFGIEMSVLASVLLGGTVGVLFIVFLMALRNRVLLKLALRNIPRRKAQTVLIIIGLMLSTTIIMSALAIGDSVAGSIRSAVLDALGETDVRLTSPIAARFGDDYIDASLVDRVREVTDGDSRVDGVMPLIREQLPVLNEATSKTVAGSSVVGVDLGSLAGFDGLKSVGGGQTDLLGLGSGKVIVNASMSDKLEAEIGDEIAIVGLAGRSRYTVIDIVENKGLAGGSENERAAAVLAVETLQGVLDRAGQYNLIEVSVDGGIRVNTDVSEELADDLQLAFINDEAAVTLFEAFKSPELVAALNTKLDEGGASTGPFSSNSFGDLVAELDKDAPSDEFKIAVTDTITLAIVAGVIEEIGNPQLAQSLLVPMSQLVELQVDAVKNRGLELAEFLGQLFVQIFSIFGSFSIIVGLLLIFLVFVMLAAERSGEMGIARAIGSKRRHLVQMFTFEGVAYSIGAAVAGTIIGLAASRLLVALLASAIGTGDEDGGLDFQFTLTATSIIAGFSLGLLLTLATVGISAYRVSRLNIVVAIRGLPAEFEPSEILPLVRRLQKLGIAFISPVWQLYLMAARPKWARSVLGEFLFLLLYVMIIPWLFRIFISFWRLISPYFRTGIPQIAIGLIVALYGISLGDSGGASFFFTMGASVLLVGVGQLVRWLSLRSGMRRERADRLGFTLMGGLVLVFWALPFTALEGLTGELSGGIEMFIVSGVWMVASAVWVVMYNADLITNMLQATFGRIQTLRPILKPAIAYPLASRFRTGLTVAMFALVIFTMMVFSILNNLGTDVVDTPDKATGGFDIRAETTSDLPVGDIAADIAAAPNLNASDFRLIAASTDVFAEARQPGAEELRFLDVAVRGVDDNYLRNVQFEMSHYDPSYLPAGIDTTDNLAVARAIWNRLAEDPTLAVVSNSLLEAPAAGGFGPPQGGFALEGISQDDDDQITAVEVSIRQPRGQGETVQLTVIGAVDAFASAFETSDGQGPVGAVTTSSAIFEQIADEPVPFTVFRIQLADGVDPGRTAAAMETAFLDNSMLATDTFEEIEEGIAQNDAFGRLFQAFMGLGLVVGVASLGVLSFRAVVERRLSIGMMRAIGYKSRMIQIQFLMESVFVTVLGTALGLGLGALISWNIVNSIQDSFDGLNYSIPWANVSVIVIIAVIAALVTTFIPARQASKIYPSEALRYE